MGGGKKGQSMSRPGTVCVETPARTRRWLIRFRVWEVKERQPGLEELACCPTAEAELKQAACSPPPPNLWLLSPGGSPDLEPRLKQVPHWQVSGPTSRCRRARAGVGGGEAGLGRRCRWYIWNSGYDTYFWHQIHFSLSTHLLLMCRSACILREHTKSWHGKKVVPWMPRDKKNSWAD